MFSYQKINIVDITKTEPIGIIRDVLVLGDSTRDDRVEEFYFKLDTQAIKTINHQYSTIGYMRAQIPLRLLNDMYLYMGVSNNEKRAMFFIEPKFFQSTHKEEISSLILKSNARHLSGKISNDLPEPLKDFYLPESIYYEFTDFSKENYGHQYLTQPLIHKVTEDEKIFHEYFNYITHYEPLTFYLNRKQLIFLSEEDLINGNMRLLQTNNKGILFELSRFHKDESDEVMQKGGNDMTDLIRLKQIKAEVEKFMAIDFA